MIKNCEFCEKPMQVRPSRLGIKRFCGWPCRKAAGLSEEHKAKLSESHKGIRNSPKTEFKPTGRVFQGTANQYWSLHARLRKKWEKPGNCDHCGHEGSSREIQWANKTGEYNESDRGDWLALCPRCHFNFDRRQNVTAA